MANNRNDCKKATFLIEKQQHAPLKFGEQIRLQIHLYGCSWCKTYQKQSKSIQTMLQHVFNDVVTPKTLDQNFKNELQTLITEKLKQI